METPRVGRRFFAARARIYMYVCEKKIDGVRICVYHQNLMTETYYSKNRAKRLSYQKAYYSLMREAIKRKRELKNFLEPKKLGFLQEYNRAYYLNNRASIRKKRADTAEKRKRADLNGGFLKV